MSGLDLEAMRGRWQESNRRADAALRLDAEAMRAALTQRTRKAFRRHSGWLVAGIVGCAVVAVALGAFLVQYGGDWRYALMAGGVLALVLAELVVDVRQFVALAKLDLGGPLLHVRATIDALRARRLKMAKWIALTAVLLWWPAILVAIRGLTGADVLGRLPPSVIWANLGIGVACIPIGLWLMSWLSRRYAGSPGFQRFLVEAAGRSWQKAEDALAAGERFEAAVAGDTWQPEAAPVELPAALVPALRALRWRLDAGIALYAALLMGTGIFNALHGGQWHAITAGVGLNLLWIAQMVASIVHRRAAARPGPDVSLKAWRDGLAGTLAGRLRTARVTAVLLPLLLAPAVSVIAGGGLLWILAGAGSVSVMLALRYRHAGEGFGRGLAEMMCLGALKATRRCLKTLDS